MTVPPGAWHPVVMDRDLVYLDHNATVPLASEVREAMEPWLRPRPANPSAVHLPGQRARAAVERAREAVASLLGVEPAGLVFTSGGTESDNAALWGALGRPPAGHLVVSAVEHPAVMEAAAGLRELGVEISAVPVDERGVVAPEAVAAALRSDTRLVSVMAANNETGALQPVERIGEVCREADVRFHCDAVQAASWVDLRALGEVADLVTLTAHKLGGPPGVGGLWVRPGLDLEPLVRGGGQQGGRRAGTEPVALIAGFGAACRRVLRLRDVRGPDVRALRDGLEARILETVDDARRNGPASERLPNTLHLSFGRCDGQALVARLDVDGIAASAGAACASGVAHPSHVLEAMGLPRHLQGGSLRLSLGYDTSADEIELAASRVPEAVGALRAAGVGAGSPGASRSATAGTAGGKG